MASARSAAAHQEDASRTHHYQSPRTSFSHLPHHPFPESTMYSASPKYHHRQDHLPRKMPYDNMKQLLSKPAVIPSLAGPSESGGYTAPREGVADISTQPKRRIVSEDTASRALGTLKLLGRGNRSISDAGGMQHSNWVAPWNLDATESSTEPLTSPKRLGFFNRSPSLTRKYVSDGENVGSGNGKGKEKEKKYHGLLRRKTSASRPTSPSSLDFKPPTIASGLASLPSPFSSSLLSPSSANVASPRSFSHSRSSTLRPPIRNTRTNSFSSSPSRGSSRNSSKSRLSVQEESKCSPPKMTPAEEVMLAYKNQMETERSIERSFEEAERKAIEARRLSDEKLALREEELERGREEMRMMQGGTIAHVQPSRGPSLLAPAKPEVTPPSTPYYTVFGSTSGRVVSASDDDGDLQHASSETSLMPAVSSLSQASHSRGRHRTASVSVGASKPSKDSPGFGKTLGRKLSVKWNGLKGSKHNSLDPEFGGRPSLHEKRFSGRRATSPATPDKGAYTALRLSIERPYATTTRVPSHRPGGESIDAAGPLKPHSAPSLSRPSASTSTSSPGSPGSSESKGGFRSIIRRLSTGALRDQNRSRSKDFTKSGLNICPNTCPPPVPALPQAVVSMMKTGAASKPTVANVSGNSTRKTRGRRSDSDNSAYSRPQTSAGTHTVLPISSASSATTSRRPSTATHSSSPERYSVSRSARSSTSSYGKEIPPLPIPNINADLPRYIHSPAELTAAQKHESNSTIIEAEKKLPIPPYQRRLRTVQTEDLDSASPTIPEFSTVSPINVFKRSTPGRPATSGGVIRASPASPFPMRNSRRPTSDSPTSPPIFHTPPSGYIQNYDGRRPSGKGVPLPPGRKSTSSVPNPGHSSSSSSPSPREGRVSTEEIWEGLLQKSARAGGTLHIYANRLESDNLRFSVTDSD